MQRRRRTHSDSRSRKRNRGTKNGGRPNQQTHRHVVAPSHHHPSCDALSGRQAKAASGRVSLVLRLLRLLLQQATKYCYRTVRVRAQKLIPRKPIQQAPVVHAVHTGKRDHLLRRRYWGPDRGVTKSARHAVLVTVRKTTRDRHIAPRRLGPTKCDECVQKILSQAR